MIYVYALTDPLRTPPAGCAGVGDAPLRVVTEGRVAAVHSRVPDAPEASAAALWAHESVVEALMGHGATLPTRFGTTLPDEARLARLLAANGAEIAAALDRVRGLVEIGVRVLWQRPVEDDREQPAGDERAEDEPGAGPGRRYLLRRAVQVRRDEARAAAEERAAEAVHAPLAAAAWDSAHEIGAAGDLLLTGAYLLAPDEVDAFVARARALDDDLPDCQLLCTGPWPPYHFVPTLRDGAVDE